DKVRFLETTSSRAQTHAEEFIECSRVFLRDDYLPKALHCIDQLSDADLWWRPNEVSNSVGNLILHLCGNLRQWIVASLGGVEFNRDRDAEFAARGPVAKAELLDNLKLAVNAVDGVLATFDTAKLLNRVNIQKYEVSAL